MPGCPITVDAEPRRVRPHRRGRSAVGWGLVLFVAFQAVYYPLSAVWPQLYDGEYGHKLANLRAQWAAKPAGQPCVVMLGSSLTGFGFNPSSLEAAKPGGPVVYNFALNSSGVVVELLCLRRLLAEGIRPDWVLVEAHPWFLLRGYNEVAGKHYFPAPRVRAGDLPVFARFDPRADELDAECAGQFWQPWFAHRLNLQNYLLPTWATRQKREELWWFFTDRNGWECMPHVMARAGRLSRQQLIESIRFHVNILNNQPVEDTFPRAYRELVDTCRAAGIKVALVRMPETTTLRDGLTPAARQRFDAAYADLQRQAGVAVIDGRTWVGDADLFDGFHMTPRGAAVFSRALERHFLGPHVFGRQN